MMTLKLQIIIGIALIIALAVIITMIRKRQLELKYSLSWIIAIIFVLVLDCFPILLNKLSFFLGIFTPVNMIFFLGFCFSMVIIFTLTVTVSRMSERIRKMAQQVAIQEETIKRLEAVKKADSEENNEQDK